MLVKLNRLAQRWILGPGIEQGKLLVIVAVLLADGFNDGARVNALVDMQRHGGYLEARPLGFTRPNQRRVQVWIVSVGLLPFKGITLGVHETNRRVVLPLLALVVV